MYRFSLFILIFWIILMAVWIVIPFFGDLETWFWLLVMWPFSAVSGLVFLAWFNKWLRAEQQKYYPPKKE